MLKPLFKWQGGKTRLLNKYEEVFLTEGHDTYIEPFFGAGAVFCKMYNEKSFKKYVINDKNHYLMEIYNTIKQPLSYVIFIKYLKQIESEYIHLNKEERKRYYYDTRNSYFKLELARNKKCEVDYNVYCVSILYFLMKTSFNGLWQPMKTKGGLFGTAFGLGNEKQLFEYDLIKLWHEALQIVDIKSVDYSQIDIPDNSLIYCDPPYIDNTVNYGEEDFNTNELLKWCQKKSERNSVFMSNRHLKSSYYEVFCNYTKKQVFEVFYTGGKKKERNKKEVLITWKKEISPIAIAA